MAVKKCPNCGNWTMFETPTGRECSKCGFAVTAPIYDEKIEMLLQCCPWIDLIKTVKTIDALSLRIKLQKAKKKDTLMQHQNTKRYILT